MKLLLIALLSLGICATSAAGTLVCQDLKGGPDHGYSLIFSKDLKTATVGKITIAGVVDRVQVNCMKNKIQNPAHPDALVTLAVCRQPNIVDAGYNVVVKTGGFAGITTAALSESTFFGANRITQFICHNQK